MRAEMPTASPEKTLETLAEKYDEIPFDDSRVLKYKESPGWEVLKQKAIEVAPVNDEIRALIAEMAEIMYSAHGVGLAAPQVGRSIQVLIYDAGDGLRSLINPKILKEKGEQYEPEEGCLSIPDLRGVVRRPNVIVVKALNAQGELIQFRATEFEARVICHEVDHLNGILFVDRADPKTLHMLTPEEKERERTPPAE
jgi:peptide deformylase